MSSFKNWILLIVLNAVKNNTNDIHKSEQEKQVVVESDDMYLNNSLTLKPTSYISKVACD